MNRAARWFWCVVIAQATFLSAWAGWHEYMRAHAPVVRLKTRPVDPRDLLRGDYMILGYEIAGVRLPASRQGQRADIGEYWLVLEPRDGHHVAVSASREKPELEAGQLAVIGSMHGWRGLQFGIENFYVPEGKGTPQFKTLEVDAVVSGTHRLYLKQVLVDGRPYP